MRPAERIRQLELLTLPFKRIDSGGDVEPAMDALRRLLPEVTEVLIDKRDQAMAQRLHTLRCEGHDVVAVIGAGHHLGIKRALDALEARDAEPVMTVPIRSPNPPTTEIPVE